VSAVGHAAHQFISCSDHGPEAVEAERCVEPDMTSFDPAAAVAAAASLSAYYSRRTLGSAGLRLIELQQHATFIGNTAE